MKEPLIPGATIGILGSGQLGRMLALEAKTMGYRVHVFSPDQDSPTGQVADKETTAVYNDIGAVTRFAHEVDVITYEFENVPAETARICAELKPLRPGPQALHTAQNRLREKQFFTSNGLPTTPFTTVHSLEDLRHGVSTLGTPAVLKTATSGYDGKGQQLIRQPDEAAAAWDAIQHRSAILEGFVQFERELSVVGARSHTGEFVHYGVIQNDHTNHILDCSTAPADLSPSLVADAVEMTHTVLEALDVVGVLCVEFFLGTNGKLLLNEMAPRPHNSGHLTIDACHTSQFGQQLRAVCGLPLGSPTFHRPAAMVNLLGDLWFADQQPTVPNWTAVLEKSNHYLHLYGKHEPRPGRKMGHITVLASTAEIAKRRALAVRQLLR